MEATASTRAGPPSRVALSPEAIASQAPFTPSHDEPRPIAAGADIERSAMMPLAVARPDEATPRYTWVAIAFHWTIGLGILAMLAMGLAMTHVKLPPFVVFKLYQLHKSIGITILLLAALRLLWRFTHRPPPLPAGMAAGGG